jgi:hypothetical protein
MNNQIKIQKMLIIINKLYKLRINYLKTKNNLNKMKKSMKTRMIMKLYLKFISYLVNFVLKLSHREANKYF